MSETRALKNRLIATLAAAALGILTVGGGVILGAGPASAAPNDATGSFSTELALDNHTNIAVDPNLIYTGGWSCAPPAGASGTTVSGTWSSIQGGMITHTGIPDGYVCTVTENTPPAVAGGVWGAADVEPASMVASSDPAANTLMVIWNSLWSTTGSFTVTKSVVNNDELELDSSLTYSGDYTCGPPKGTAGSAVHGTWSTTAGNSDQIDNIPAGYVCTVTENKAPAVNGGLWAAPTFAPTDGVVISNDVEEIGDITVTNTLTTAPTTGAFQVKKTVVNTGAVPLGSTVTFGGTYTCTPPGESDASPVTGTWSTKAGATTTITDIPVGFTCTVTENTPPAVDGGTWGSAPAIDPADGVTIAADPSEVGLITVTNTLTPVKTTSTPTPTPTSSTPMALANTGSDTTGSIIAAGLAGLLLVGGSVTLVLARRKRA